MATLAGKTALVTGASRGIGRSSALALAQAGARLLIHYSRGEQEAEAVVQEIRKAGGSADRCMSMGAQSSDADGREGSDLIEPARWLFCRTHYVPLQRRAGFPLPTPKHRRMRH
jgi:NAD(P)-dependent dehydrogenase (short-subunit alcohol dehydrogenase family)